LTARTLRITAAIAAIFLLGGLVSVATARRAAETKVTIQGGGGEYFGYVKSTKLKCKNNRKVKLYKQLGSEPHPRTDKFINSDLAQPNGNGYQWNTGSTGVHHGKVYARAGRIEGCKPDNSRTIHAS
jgi:hypothetical protein